MVSLHSVCCKALCSLDPSSNPVFRGHENEEQFACAYCRSRFTNKNAAERHQNSLHDRRRSWSCAALSGFEAAFNLSSITLNEADTCGYCGEEFRGTGPIDNLGIKALSGRDRELRIEHLIESHKFGECNHAKKFFRADHFRLHLKHSHSATIGKWTDMLENACMKDEPLPIFPSISVQREESELQGRREPIAL